jgi:calmodulin
MEDARREAENEEREMLRVFARLDTKKDGYIDAEELQTVMLNFGCNVSELEASRMIWEVDDDHDNRLSLAEFRRAFQRGRRDRTGWEPDDLFCIAEFMFYDKDHGGAIDVGEAMELCRRRYGDRNLLEKTLAFFGIEGGGDVHDLSISFSDCKYIAKCSATLLSFAAKHNIYALMISSL